MAVSQYIREDVNAVFAPVATATLVDIGDFCALVAGEVVPGANFSWAGSKAQTQYNFVASLLGHSFQYKQANVANVYGNSTSNIIGASTSGVYEADVQSATTFAVGDFVGLAKNPSANELLSQVVEKVAALSSGIGVVVTAGVNLTRVQFRMIPTKVPFQPAPATTTSTTTSTSTTAAPTTTTTSTSTT
jgi:hypothetical protein